MSVHLLLPAELFVVATVGRDGSLAGQERTAAPLTAAARPAATLSASRPTQGVLRGSSRNPSTLGGS